MFLSSSHLTTNNTMKLLILAVCVAVAAASQTYDKREVRSYGKRDYGYDRGYGYDDDYDYGYGRRDYGYGRRDYGYGRRDYGYGRRDYGYGRRDYGYGRRDYGYDNDYSYDKKDDYKEPEYKEVEYKEPEYKEPEYKEPEYKDDDYSSYGTVYYGKYDGKCGNDGLYYRDEKSFIFCSNGSSYVQPCAPGTRNSAYSKYDKGAKYNYRDFCDVNLVDDGYAAKKKASYH